MHDCFKQLPSIHHPDKKIQYFFEWGICLQNAAGCQQSLQKSLIPRPRLIHWLAGELDPELFKDFDIHVGQHNGCMGLTAFQRGKLLQGQARVLAGGRARWTPEKGCPDREAALPAP